MPACHNGHAFWPRPSRRAGCFGIFSQCVFFRIRHSLFPTYELLIITKPCGGQVLYQQSFLSMPVCETF